MTDRDTRRIALVTGAGSGIGRVAAEGLGRDGFTLVLAGRRSEALEETARRLAAAGAEALPVVTDVGDPASVERLFGRIREAYGRLDVLFNNAGQNPPGTAIEDMAFEVWQSTVNANLTGVFLCTQHAMRMMKAQTPRGGRIINNGSLAAYVPRPLSVAYTATKHGVTGLTRQTALDGRAHNIACGQIDIGNARSAMTMDRDAGVLQPDGSLRPEPRLEVEHVADAVRYMAGLPLEANVLFMSVMATAMPYVGRG